MHCFSSQGFRLQSIVEFMATRAPTAATTTAVSVSRVLALIAGQLHQRHALPRFLNFARRITIPEEPAKSRKTYRHHTARQACFVANGRRSRRCSILHWTNHRRRGNFQGIPICLLLIPDLGSLKVLLGYAYLCACMCAFVFRRKTRLVLDSIISGFNSCWPTTELSPTADTWHLHLHTWHLHQTTPELSPTVELSPTADI